MIVEAIRVLIVLAFTVIGLQLAPEMTQATGEGAVENARLIGAIVGAGVGYVVGGVGGRWFRSGIAAAPQMFATGLSGAELFTGGFGLLIGVVMGVVLSLPALLLISGPLAFPVAGLILLVVASIFGTSVCQPFGRSDGGHRIDR